MKMQPLLISVGLLGIGCNSCDKSREAGAIDASSVQYSCDPTCNTPTSAIRPVNGPNDCYCPVSCNVLMPEAEAELYTQQYNQYCGSEWMTANHCVIPFCPPGTFMGNPSCCCLNVENTSYGNDGCLEHLTQLCGGNLVDASPHGLVCGGDASTPADAASP